MYLFLTCNNWILLSAVTWGLAAEHRIRGVGACMVDGVLVSHILRHYHGVFKTCAFVAQSFNHSNVGTPSAFYSKIDCDVKIFCNLSRRRSEHYVWWVLLDSCVNTVRGQCLLLVFVNKPRVSFRRRSIRAHNVWASVLQPQFLQVLATLVGSLLMHVVSSSYSHPKLVLIRMQFLTSSFQLTNKEIL